MAKLSTDELLDAFKEMTLIELSEFVKQFEDTFDVTAAAPVAVAAAPAAGGAGGGEAAAEQDEFDVVLEAAGDKKIQVIKEVRPNRLWAHPDGGDPFDVPEPLPWPGQVRRPLPSGSPCRGPSGSGPAPACGGGSGCRRRRRWTRARSRSPRHD
jgi:hypothetical protein